MSAKRIWKYRGHVVIEARLRSQWKFAPPSDLKWSNFWLVPKDKAAAIIAISDAGLVHRSHDLELRVKP